MMRFAILVLVCSVYGDEVNGTNAGADVATDDATSAENMPDPEELNAPTEDLSIADKVAAESVDESQNDIDGTEEETEPQAETEEMDTFTDTVQSQPADDDSNPETYTDKVEPQTEDGAVARDEPATESEIPKDPDGDSSETTKESLAGLEVNSSLTVVANADKFEPYDGTEIPAYVGTFPGCTCVYSEYKRRWKCKGTIAYPKSVAGDECCCCKLSCQWRNRCSNEQCEAIGIDQAEEVAEEERRMKELMKGADLLVSDELPGFIVELDKGQCRKESLLKACNAKGLTPLCDHTTYSRGECFSPGRPGTKFHNRHFSHWGGHRQHFGIDDDYLFYGMCFFAINGPWALAPCNGNSHCWTNGNHRLSPPARVLAQEPVPNIHFNDLNNCQGGLGCWRTICVKESPNHLHR